MKTDFYVYAYLDPTQYVKIETQNFCFLFQPIYIGKGRENRLRHGVDALLSENYLLTNKMLYGKLCSLEKREHSPCVIKVIDGITSAESLSIEGSLIDQLGRIGKEPFGILCNRRKQHEMPDPTGKPKQKVSSEKMKATRIKNGSYYTGSKHAMAKRYILTSPSSERFEIHGALKKFCEDNNLSWQTLYSHIGKGKIKLDPARYKNTARLTERFWNSLDWSIELDS